MEPSIFNGSLPLILEDDEIFDAPRGVLDTLEFKILTGPDWKDDLAAMDIAREIILPPSFPYHAMFVRDMRVRERSAATATVAVSCIGLLESGEKRKTTISAVANRISLGPEEKKSAPITDSSGNIIEWNIDGSWIMTDSGLIPREFFPSRLFGGVTTVAHPAWSIANPKISLTSIWFATTEPDPNVVGREMAPPVEIETPESEIGRGLWEWINVRKNSPEGWVCDSRQIEPLFIGENADSPNYTPPPPGTPVTLRGLWAVTDQISFYFQSDPM